VELDEQEMSEKKLLKQKDFFAGTAFAFFVFAILFLLIVSTTEHIAIRIIILFTTCICLIMGFLQLELYSHHKRLYKLERKLKWKQ
jgi:positive regulator of sigma E activity